MTGLVDRAWGKAIEATMTGGRRGRVFKQTKRDTSCNHCSDNRHLDNGEKGGGGHREKNEKNKGCR